MRVTSVLGQSGRQVAKADTRPLLDLCRKVPTIGRKLAMKRLELTKLIGGGNSLSTDAPSGAGIWEIGRLLIVR